MVENAMAHILYFAGIRERLGLGSERLELPDDVKTVANLLAWLRGRGGAYAEALSGTHVQVAVNQHHAQPGDSVANDDEIALFPPVSGG
jgi:molybdopterin synthase sulfur carrier subunit